MEQRHEYTLVTGASSVIGKAVVRRISHAGRVILHGEDLDSLRTFLLELANPDTHLIWCEDLVGNDEIMESLSGFLSRSAGVVTSFIHCAEELRFLPVSAVDPASVLRTFQINYSSATAIIRALLKKSVNRGSLRAVIFLSSIRSRFGAKGYGLYGATKGALDSLSRSLAVELSPTVRVNSILPGNIRTEDAQGREVEGMDNLTDGSLLAPGGADDIAGMVEYLMSDRARWITGQQFVIDGGTTAH